MTERHINFYLSDIDDDPHRPTLSVWVDDDNGTGVPCVSVSIGPLHGQQQRFISLATGEARQLAKALIAKADQIEDRDKRRREAFAGNPRPSTIVESPLRKMQREMQERAES